MRARAISAVVLALIAACAWAQPGDAADPAHRGAVLAEALVEEGKHAAAVRELHASLSACDELETADECHGRLRFALGWVERRWAQSLAVAGTEGSREHLRRAAEHLARAQALLPGRREVVAERVLSLRDLGRVAEALALWRDQASGSARPQDRILLGDLEGLAGDDAAARSTYFGVEPSRPHDLELHRRILSTYRRAPGDPQEHRAWCRRLWQRDLDAMAITGLEVLLSNEGGDDRELVDWVLLQWTDLEAQTGGVEPSDLDRLPGAAEGRGLDELRRLVEGPAGGLEPGSGYEWWRRTPLHRHVAAVVLRLRSQSEEAAGSSEAAVRVVEAATRWAPTPEEHEEIEHLAGRPVAWVDARTDLAALYHRLGAADELERLVEGLPTEGGGRLGSDLPSAYRFHTVLGVVLFDREHWRPRSSDGALFQFQRAIEISGELAEQPPRTVRPVPALHRYLGHARTAVGKGKDGARSFFEAAQGFLDLDDLRSTADVLGRISGQGFDGLATLQSVLSLRGQADRGEIGVERILPELARESTWLGGAEIDGLAAPFLRRQRFKIASDVLESELAAGRDLASDKDLQRLASVALEATAGEPLATETDRRRRRRYAESVAGVCGPPRTAGDRPSIDSCSGRVFTWRHRTGYFFCVCGDFPRSEHRRGLFLDGRPLGTPMAETETALVFALTPDIGPGTHRIAGSPAAGFSPHDAANLTVVRLGYEFDFPRFRKKRKAKLKLSVEGTDEPVDVELVNRSPGLVTITGGDHQVISLRDGDREKRKVKAPRTGQDIVARFTLEALDKPGWHCATGGETGEETDD